MRRKKKTTHHTEVNTSFKFHTVIFFVQRRVLLQFFDAMPPKIEVVKGRNNKVYTWGSGFMGQLGHGDRSSFDWPRNVQVLDGNGIIQLAAGPGDHVVGLTGAS